MLQSPVLSLAAIATVAVALALLASFAVAVLNVQQLTAAWSEDTAIVIYLDDAAEEQAVNGWVKSIRSYPQVAKVVHVSHVEAFKRFKKRLGADADLLEGLEPEVLPASLEVQMKSDHRQQKAVEELVVKLRREFGFSDINYARKWLEKFEAFLLLLRFAGATLGSFLVFAALIIVANTIKLTLFARQDELEAMALVGGTPLFIKLPYLVEGTLQGLLGGVLALVVSFLLFKVMLMKVLGHLLLITGIDTIHFLPPIWQVLLVVGGGCVGLLGSLFALRKFVRIGPA